MEQVSYKGHTNIKRHRTKFSRHGDLTTGIYKPVLYTEINLFNRKF